MSTGPDDDARLEQYLIAQGAEPGEVLVSESLAEAERGSGRFGFDVFEVPALKGYDHPVGAYRLQSPPL